MERDRTTEYRCDTALKWSARVSQAQTTLALEASCTATIANFAALRFEDCQQLDTPCLLLSEDGLVANAQILDSVRQKSGCRILLALKAFAHWPLFKQLSSYFDGVCASGLYEAQLGHQEFGGEVHSYSPAYNESELLSLLTISHHLVFNSITQWQRFKNICEAYHNSCSFGLRINPRCSVVPQSLYDPSSLGSRLGMFAEDLDKHDLGFCSGLHFHNLCEQGVEPLQKTLTVFEKLCARHLKKMQWCNWGGGHHISKPSYQRETLIAIIKDFQQRYSAQVILEPGEAVALHSGILLTRVLDICAGDPPTAILDTSFTCHMPDVLEMPYRPIVWGATAAYQLDYTYNLGGRSCLAGDRVDGYSFKEKLKVGDLLVLDDMAHYTSVKMNTFNGVPLPLIASYTQGNIEILRIPHYEDFKGRLG